MELICPNCSQKYEDPRLLPCGDSVCQPCLATLTNTLTNQITCPHCHQKHPLTGEFPRNNFIARMLEKKAHDVKRGRLSEKLKTIVRSLVESRDELERISRASSEYVSDHCRSIQCQIDVSTETQIERLNKHRDYIIKQIKDYERECIQYLDHMLTNDQCVDSFCTEIDGFVEKVRAYLKETDLDEAYIENSIKTAQNYARLAMEKSSRIEERIFLRHKPVFKASDV